MLRSDPSTHNSLLQCEPPGADRCPYDHGQAAGASRVCGLWHFVPRIGLVAALVFCSSHGPDVVHCHARHMVVTTSPEAEVMPTLRNPGPNSCYWSRRLEVVCNFAWTSIPGDCSTSCRDYSVVESLRSVKCNMGVILVSVSRMLRSLTFPEKR